MKRFVDDVASRVSALAAKLGLDRASRAEQQLWASARTRDDVAELTAQWLEGRIRTQPSYRAPVDVDEDLAPGMTGALIALNRAGVLTDQSQGGHDGDFRQQAAVSCFASAEAAANLRAAVGREPDLVVADLRAEQAPVGGGRPTARELADSWTGYGICHPDAVAEIAAAKQLCVYDREPGRNDRLWPALNTAAEQVGSNDDVHEDVDDDVEEETQEMTEETTTQQPATVAPTREEVDRMAAELPADRRGWDGQPLDEKGQRLYALRESGWTGWVDQDGYAVDGPPFAKTSQSDDDADEA